MEKFSIYSIMDIISILFAIIGVYFFVRIWKVWKNINMNIVKARIFLDKRFLEKNWIYILLAGATMTVRQILFLIFFPYDNFAIISTSFFVVSELLELIIFIILVALAYEWFKILIK
ncbi:MAG: hypothetical protein PHU34_05375 [Candidatus Methanoperedens sp.]|nr:hypothetical protein [Candidatus Methanoperedens sp.]